nr:unnamed protein product [Digitaria exilis]
MSSWVLDVERALAEHSDASSESSSRWQRHCIYRVPACIKHHNPKAYKPQVVSLGPFHHGDSELLPMEDHKRRALRHLLRRSGRRLEAFRAAVQDAGEQLEDAYQDLGVEWSGGGGRERFLEMLVVDGCFLLELMMVAGAGEDEGRSSGGGGGGYAPNDPVFSRHGMLYMVPFIRRDMLMLENQLPLLSHDEINRMVLRFVSPSSRPPPASASELGLHPLAIYHGSLVHGQPYRVSGRRDVPDTGGAEIIRPATELHEAGIKFKKSWTDSLRDVRFFRRGGVLSVPAMSVDDSTEYALLNAMAFERLHAGGVAAGAGNDVAAYVFFMGKLLDSARDVALLGSMGIVQNAAGSDEAVAKLFERMSKDMVLDPSETELDAVHRQVNAYCRRRRPWRMCGGGSGARQSRPDACLRTPWVLFAIIVLLVVVIVQTIYIVLQFYELRHR